MKFWDHIIWALTLSFLACFYGTLNSAIVKVLKAKRITQFVNFKFGNNVIHF